MILVDGVYINEGGGLVLLEYLINFLEKQSSDFFYLLDKRTESFFSKFIDPKKCDFIDNGFFSRYKFYSENKKSFKTIFCFGNLPPFCRTESNVIVYFHQKLFLEIPSDFPKSEKIKFKIKQIILGFFSINANYWLVQNNSVANLLAVKYLRGNIEQVKVLPFYPEINFANFSGEKEANSFIYVSNSSPHKNHIRLIDAFCDAIDRNIKAKLILTVPLSDVKLCEILDKKISDGYPIENLGFIDRTQLIEFYWKAEFLIFPSLSESFGLGLVEAIDAGCKVIASDLDYTYDVCIPSLVFNPYDTNSIMKAIITATQENLPHSEKLIQNQTLNILKLILE